MPLSFLAPPPQASGQEPGSRLLGRSALLLALCASLFMLVLNVFYREFYTGDEGFYGVMALNMQRSAAYWLRPSYYPEGSFLLDQNAFAHPPFNSYFYAVALWLSHGSLASLEVVNALAFGALLFFSYRLLGRFDSRAGAFAVLLLAASPAILGLYSQLEAEPLLVTFGVMGLYCALRAGFHSGYRRFFFLAGLCLGMAFALKLWLCGPLALAIAAALWPALVGDDVRSLPVPGGVERGKFRDSSRRLLQGRNLLALGAVALGGLLPAGLHLLVIRHYYPGDLGYWLKDIYFGFFTGAGISGTKAGGANVPADWVHPVWYYGAVLYRDHFFLGPVLLLGLGAAFRDERLKARLLWALLAGVAGLLPLSLIKVKEPLYILSCTVLLYLLAGCCLAAVVGRLESGARLQKWPWRLATSVSAGLLLMVLGCYARGILKDKITAGFVCAHTVVLMFFLLGLWWLRRKAGFEPKAETPLLQPAEDRGPRAARLLVSPASGKGGGLRAVVPMQWGVGAACALAVLTGFGHGLVCRAPLDRAIAQVVQPYVAGNPPQSLSLIASNFKCFQLYLFRRGCYWHELGPAQGPEAMMASPRFAHVRAFILAPEELQQPAMARWLAWLQTHTQEKTQQLTAALGCASGWRVFVR